MSNSNKNIAEIRRDYQLKELDESHIQQNPFEQLEKWVKEAIYSELYEPTAMVLSTVSPEGKPSSRVLLLKGIDMDGLIFYTNYQSKKGRNMEQNPFVCINFFWPELERQVRVEGKIEKVSTEESDRYFLSRPRGSQLGAISSPQSEVIESRKQLELKVTELEKQFENKEIVRPNHWGGYRLKPVYFEFWQGRPNRLHDRIVYELADKEWEIKRLAP